MNGAKHKIHFLHLPLIIMLFAVNQAVAQSGGVKMTLHLFNYR